MKNVKNHLKLATGAAVVASFAIGSVAHAADNPFAMQKLDSGYQLAQADKKADGKCGGSKAKDGACGGAKVDDKKKDGKCGEGKCGADTKAADDKKAAADKKKDGKCGEGKCGGAKK
ncbi:MAG: HvfA family oxazolone/thioamide-modified RiPP metallophore [Rhodocyclaceae bacterium]